MRKSRSKIISYISVLLALILAIIALVYIIFPDLIKNLILTSLVLILLIFDVLLFIFNEPDFQELPFDWMWRKDAGAASQKNIVNKLQKFCLKIDNILKGDKKK